MEPAWPRRCADGVAAADASALLALRGRRALGLAGRIRCGAAVPGGRCRAPSCAAGRVDVGAAVQQRRDERRRGGDRRCRAQYGFDEGAAAWTRLLADYPSVQAQFAAARPSLPFVHAPRVAHRTAVVAGRDWALLPSAAGVIDPLLSTGFPLTLLGIGRLARVLEETSPGSAREAALARYAQDTTEELDATERLVAALYAHDVGLPAVQAPDRACTSPQRAMPRRCVASGSRIGRRGFLLHADPVFGPALRGIAERALALPVGEARHAARQRLLDDIARAIAPFDVAGLGDTTRRDWYPVLASDLHAAHERLGVSRAAIDALLARCGFDNATCRLAARVRRAGARMTYSRRRRARVDDRAGPRGWVPLSACRRTADVSPEAYREAVVAFHTGPGGDATPARKSWRARSWIVSWPSCRRSPRAGPTSGCCCCGNRRTPPARQRLTRAAELAPACGRNRAPAGARREPRGQSRGVDAPVAPRRRTRSRPTRRLPMRWRRRRNGRAAPMPTPRRSACSSSC